jgi:SAM-dependent methyltransferase
MPKHVLEFGAFGRPPESDGRLDTPAFHRNQAAIWSVLAPHFVGRTGDVLEVGSGSGQHAIAFALAAPAVTWWPSDCNDQHLASIDAWRAHVALANLQPPTRLDLLDPDLNLRGLPGEFLAIVCINVLHISPWIVSEHLLSVSGRHLRAEGRLFIYGPFMRDGAHTAPSNAAFDAALRADDAEWGVRDVADLARAGARAGLALAETVAMPANNFILVFERRARPQ